MGRGKLGVGVLCSSLITLKKYVSECRDKRTRGNKGGEQRGKRDAEEKRIREKEREEIKDRNKEREKEMKTEERSDDII